MPPYNPRDRARALAAAKKAARSRPKPKPVPVSRDVNGPHRGTGLEKPKSSTKPTYSTKRPKDAAKKLAVARAARRLERAGFHKQARELRAGLPLSKDFGQRVAEDLTSAAKGFPGGVYQIGKAAALDLAKPKHEAVPFGRTRHIGAEIGRQYARDYRHPIRYAQQHPGFVALDLSAALSAGAGTAARAGAAGRALETGGARAAAKAFVKRPLPETRVHTYKGQPVRGRYSTNAAVRALQKRRDRASTEIGATKAERLLSEERRVTDAAAKAPALRALSVAPGRRASSKIVKLFGRHPSGTVEDAAIRVVAEGVPVDEVIAAHKRMAAQIEVRLKNRRRGGVPGGGHTTQQAFRLNGARRELLRRAAVYDEARKYLDVDANGEPVISAAHPELASKLEVTKTAALTREARAKKIGLLTREAAERRKNAPGAAMVKTVSGGRAVEIERPRTVAEAQARFDKIDAQVEKLVARGTKITYDLNPHDFQAAARTGKRPDRIVDNPVRRKHGGQVDIQRSGEEARLYGTRYGEDEAKLSAGKATATELAREEFLRKLQTSQHPTAVRLRELMAEHDELRQALAVEAEKGTFAEGLTEGGSLGQVTEFKGFDEVEPFSGGKFRVPDFLKSQRVPHGPLQVRGGVTRKPQTFTKTYTGAGRRSGKYTPHTIRATAEDALEFERYASADRFRQRLLPMGERVRPPDTRSVKYVPIKERDLSRRESKQLRDLLDEADPETLTPDEATRIEERLKAYEREVFPDPSEYAHVRPGQAVAGVKWIDRRLLGSQRKLVGRLPVIDATSDVIKGLILYAKPGYVAPNVLGNIGYNLFQQGFLAPANWARSVRLPRDLDFMVKEVMGSGYSRALAEGTMSPASYAVRKAGDFWSTFVDDPFRKAAFIHEARRYGFKSHDQMRSLIMDGQHRAQLGEIAQRARDAIVDYERLGPLERDLVRRVLFVYPWVKGSTYYAGQFLRDHPIQAAVFARIGQQGESKALEELGPMPAWAQGSFKVGGSEDQPTIVNPQSVSPFSTPAQVIGMAGGAFGDTERSEQIGEATNPLLQSAIEAGFGRDLFTGRELHGSLGERFIGQMGKGLPQYLLYKRGGLNFIPGVDEHVSPDATYPYSPADARAQFVFGSAFPRPANRAKLNEQAAGALDPAARVKRDIQKERDELTALFKGAHQGDKLPPPINRALKRKQAVEELRAEVQRQYGKVEEADVRNRTKFEAELDLLARWGAMKPAEVRRAKSWAAKADLEDVREARRYLVSHYFEDAYLQLLHDSRKYLEDRQ